MHSTSTIRQLALTFAFFALAVLVPTSIHSASAQESVDDAGRALGRAGLPWYDAEKEDVQPIPQPRNAPKWWPDWNFQAGNAIWFGQFIRFIFIAALVLILSLIVYALVRAYLRLEQRRERDVGEHVQVLTDEARIEQLPFNVREPNADLLEQARRFYQDGDFNEAIVYLYSYMLLHLDKNRCIRLSKGKTNRQYLGELRQVPNLFSLLERTMISFEEAFFGKHRLERDDFEASWRQLDKFHETVTETAN